jgi:hypothetical protein
MERSVGAAKDWEVGSPCKPQFRIEANSFGSGLSVYHNAEQDIPVGKYRALFFLVPVK